MNVSCCYQSHIVLYQHVLPRNLQRLEHGTLYGARVLQRKVGACCSVEWPVRCENNPGGE